MARIHAAGALKPSSCRTVNAVLAIRKMRGGSQAHLLKCDDGSHYVVKFRNNPQHRRTLINEWLAAEVLRALDISAPRTAVVHLSEEFIVSNPALSIEIGCRMVGPVTGPHFGSCHPGHPESTAIYDFLPDAMLQRLENLHDFLGMLVVDKWLANADKRQCIFSRTRGRGAGPRSNGCGLVAHMIDHGYCFNGPHWNFVDSPLSGTYFRTIVYESVHCVDDFDWWLARIAEFPEHVLYQAVAAVPPDWIETDGGLLDSLLQRLLRRRSLVPDLIQQTLKTDRFIACS